ncbi:MAG: hypothetical protein F6J92_36275 [Symploca sp. SIO1A3]|nr:hypothetical protein [Symploca sp. SIO1A3]
MHSRGSSTTTAHPISYLPSAGGEGRDQYCSVERNYRLKLGELRELRELRELGERD